MGVSLILFIVTVGLIVFMSKIDKQTEETTTLYTATVKNVDITDTGTNVSLEIFTEEYSTSLLVSTNIAKHLSLDDIKELNAGQAVFFRIDDAKSEQMNTVAFLDIVSLKTEAKEIFSLEEYNELIHESAKPARILGYILSVLFLSIALICFFKIKTARNNRSND